MLDFMDYVQQAFYSASHWNSDNFYGTLNTTNLGTDEAAASPYDSGADCRQRCSTLPFLTVCA